MLDTYLFCWSYFTSLIFFISFKNNLYENRWFFIICREYRKHALKETWILSYNMQFGLILLSQAKGFAEDVGKSAKELVGKTLQRRIKKM